MALFSLMALCCSCASPEVGVLANGSRLVVVTREDHRVRWEMALEAEVGAAYFPLALQPTGEQVASCMKELKTVSVHDLRTGEELYSSDLSKRTATSPSSSSTASATLGERQFLTS